MDSPRLMIFESAPGMFASLTCGLVPSTMATFLSFNKTPSSDPGSEEQ